MNQALEVNEGNFSDPGDYADNAIRAQYGIPASRDIPVLDYLASGLTRMANKDLYAQYYNAQVDRIYNASEAQKNRAWQEMMSNTAFRRQMEDLKAAGINPLYMFMGSGSGASTPSGASSSYSSSVNPKSKEISKILSSLIMAMGRIIAGVL